MFEVKIEEKKRNFIFLSITQKLEMYILQATLLYIVNYRPVPLWTQRQDAIWFLLAILNSA